jgi:hypothetical protein
MVILLPVLFLIGIASRAREKSRKRKAPSM